MIYFNVFNINIISYKDEEMRKIKAQEWDQKEREMMEAFYQQRFKLMDKIEKDRRLPPKNENEKEMEEIEHK